MDNDQTPATKADLRRLETTILQKMDRIQDAIDRIITVLANVDKRLTKSVDDHETRIRRLETRVGIGVV